MQVILCLFVHLAAAKNLLTDALIWNGKKMSAEEFIYFHPEPGNYSPKSLSDFTVIKIDSFFTEDILQHYTHVEN